MEVAVLGPVEVRLDARAVDLGTPKQRALVAALALSRGRAVSVDAIVDLLWGEAPPPGVTATLQAYVSALRRVLEPQRERRAPAQVLVTVAPGYALRVGSGATDLEAFEGAITTQHRVLQRRDTASRTQLTEALAALDEALALWRGTPFLELDAAPAALAERTRLEELRLVALEDRAVAGLALGHHGEVAAELEALTSAHPLRERLWALRALALARGGRQADALEVLRSVRDLLDEELGLEPGQELRDLQTAILRQDPALDWRPPAEEPEPPVTAPTPGRAPVVPRPRAESDIPEPVAPWPMVGRDDELGQLLGALSAAESGPTSYAVLTGEPGIGKSRLAAELGARALTRGFQVLVGRCSQDDGAPPLWPWTQVLDELGVPLPDAGADDEGAAFRTWEQIVRTVREAATARPTLVLLDDLHWADASTLRVLRLLTESTDVAARLLVLVTWRAHPEPTGALADVSEALARRHATRLALDGLPAAAVAEVFDAVSHNRPSEDQADALRVRTDGNPFFVVEYARLAGERGDLARLVAEEHPPSGVQEVLGRRLARLPEPTVASLQTAALVGRRFDADTLALATGLDPDDLLDIVEPALAAGLVREVGIDRFTFAHALVRDSLASAMSASRRARAHARIARALEGAPGRETEVATHWLAAGPSYAASAWRTAVDAAAATSRLHAHEQTADLLRRALAAQADDAAATPRDRYDVLLLLTDAYRWAAMWPELTAVVEEAVAVAETIGDPRLIGEAAIATTQGALWQSAAHGQVHVRIVAALRNCLVDLPPEDDVLRCRVMLGLANELYYGASFEERRALVDAALAMARRLGDEALLLDACQIAFVSLWCPATAAERLALAAEAVGLAERVGNERSFVVAACLRAVVLAELGRPGEMWPAIEVALAEAERLRIHYGVMVLDSLALPWRAMAGEFEECAALIERIQRMDAQISLEQSEDATAGALISLSMWKGQSAETAPILESMEGGPFPISGTIVVFLWRGGEEERARAYYEAHRPLALGSDDWFSMLAHCNAAETALHMGDPELAAECYDWLAPYAGMSCSAGSGNASGPVDAFLAMAAMATGERDLATRHADAAARSCEEWGIPLAGAWLREQRRRYGF